MILATGCLGAARLDGAAVRAALEMLGLDEVLLVVGENEHPRELGGLRVAGVRAPADSVDRGLALAASTRSPRLVVDLPADAELDPACRAVHALARRAPGLALALTTPAEGPLARPSVFALLLEDLSGLDLGYWHVPSRVCLGGDGDADWFDGVGRWLAGLSVDDVVDGAAGLPPGLGEIDFAAVAAAITKSVPTALDVEPLQDVGMLRLALDALAAKGFR